MNEKTTNVVTSMSAFARSSCSSCSCPTNNSMETAQEINVETLISGYLCCPGVEQWFKFTVPEKKSYTIFTTSSLDTEGALYDCNCNRIDDETTNIRINGKLDLRIKCELLVGMTYYLCVSEAKGNTGTYTLKVTKDILAEAGANVKDEVFFVQSSFLPFLNSIKDEEKQAVLAWAHRIVDHL